MNEPDVAQCFAGAGLYVWTARPFDLGKGEASPLTFYQAAVEWKLAYLKGACLLASRAFSEAKGLLDERFFLYFEEIAWQWAAALGFGLGLPRRRSSITAVMPPAAGRNDTCSPTAGAFIP